MLAYSHTNTQKDNYAILDVTESATLQSYHSRDKRQKSLWTVSDIVCSLHFAQQYSMLTLCSLYASAIFLWTTSQVA